MKKLTEWVEKSFVNKTIFVLSIIGVLLIVFVLIPSVFKTIHKMNLIDSGVVYVTKDGTRYHLFDDCSNMSKPRETTENNARSHNLERCNKCYAGVKNFSGYSYWGAMEWITLVSGIATVIFFAGSFLVRRKFKTNFVESPMFSIKGFDVLGVLSAIAFGFSVIVLITF